MSTEKFARELDAVKGNRALLSELWRDSIEAFHQITNGRSPMDMTPDEYLKDLFEKKNKWTPKFQIK